MAGNQTRSQNVALNTIWAITAQIVTVFLGLFNRKVFLNYLGAELLGVNSLFSDVLMLFSFADLGFGTAIMFSMYKPIAEDNTEKVESLLYFYRTIYRYVIIVLTVISFIFIPFLRSIKTEIDLKSLTIYYFFFQASNILEYVWAYRESYVIACQRERELSIWNLVYNISKNIGQIVIIILWHNFIAYLSVGLFCVVIKKYFVNRYILKRYPITSLNNVAQLPKDEKKSIIKKSSALLITKVGNLIINQTDSLIVSYLISVTQWGFASNYLVIKKAIFNLSDKIYSSVLPSMGNLLVESEKEHQTKVFLKYDFLNAWMQTFFFVSFVCLSSPFITLFFGTEAVLDDSFVFVFFLASFVDGLRNPVSVMREAGGSFEQDKWYTLVAAVVNIAVSIPLALKLGLIGVYIGTICAMLVLHISRTAVLMKDSNYDVSLIKYLTIILRHVFIGLLLGGITFALVKSVGELSINKYFLFLIQCIMVVIVPNTLWCLVYYKKTYFKEFFGFVINKIKAGKIG